MGRAEHGETVDFATIEKLSRNQQGLDSLPDADIVSNQKPHRVESKRHEQRHQLIGARLDGNPAK
jgi:hypothetical protein